MTSPMLGDPPDTTHDQGSERADPQPRNKRSQPSWGRALKIATSRTSLKKTILAASIVGTTLTFVNLFGPLTSGPLTSALAFKLLLTYAVPWGNATFGIALGIRGQGR